MFLFSFSQAGTAQIWQYAWGGHDLINYLIDHH